VGRVQRDRERRPYTPVGPASWTMGTDNLKLCTIGKKIFCTGPTGSAVKFFLLQLPSKIHRLGSVNTENEPVYILYTFMYMVTANINLSIFFFDADLHKVRVNVI
jgi:hypothetical protein